MAPGIGVGLAAMVLVLLGCADSPRDVLTQEGVEPRFRLTVEEAGLVAKGELFRIYGEAADPVIVDVAATEETIDGEPAWQLDTLVHVLVEGQIQERRWRFWVALDPDGIPAVLRGEEIGRHPDG